MIFNNNNSLIYDSDYDSIVTWSVRMPSLTEISDRNSRISITSIDYGSTEYHIKPISIKFRKNRPKNIRHKILIQVNISTFSKNYSENHLDRRIYYLNGTEYPRSPLFLRKNKN